MTTKQLQAALLNYYLFVIEWIKEDSVDFREAHRIIRETYTVFGVCTCLSWVTGKEFPLKKWMRNGYLPMPFSAVNKEQIIYRLMIRVNNLQNELS
jgi:hypothetical protein